MISLERKTFADVICKRTMVDIFSGSTAKTKRQESERKQQTVLHNAKEVKFVPRPKGLGTKLTPPSCCMSEDFGRGPGDEATGSSSALIRPGE